MKKFIGIALLVSLVASSEALCMEVAPSAPAKGASFVKQAALVGGICGATAAVVGLSYLKYHRISTVDSIVAPLCAAGICAIGGAVVGSVGSKIAKTFEINGTPNTKKVAAVVAGVMGAGLAAQIAR